MVAPARLGRADPGARARHRVHPDAGRPPQPSDHAHVPGPGRRPGGRTGRRRTHVVHLRPVVVRHRPAPTRRAGADPRRGRRPGVRSRQPRRLLRHRAGPRRLPGRARLGGTPGHAAGRRGDRRSLPRRPAVGPHRPRAARVGVALELRRPRIGGRRPLELRPRPGALQLRRQPAARRQRSVRPRPAPLRRQRLSGRPRATLAGPIAGGRSPDADPPPAPTPVERHVPARRPPSRRWSRAPLRLGGSARPRRQRQAHRVPPRWRVDPGRPTADRRRPRRAGRAHHVRRPLRARRRRRRCRREVPPADPCRVLAVLPAAHGLPRRALPRPPPGGHRAPLHHGRGRGDAPGHRRHRAGRPGQPRAQTGVGPDPRRSPSRRRSVCRCRRGRVRGRHRSRADPARRRPRRPGDPRRGRRSRDARPDGRRPQRQRRPLGGVARGRADRRGHGRPGGGVLQASLDRHQRRPPLRLAARELCRHRRGARARGRVPPRQLARPPHRRDGPVPARRLPRRHPHRGLTRPAGDRRGPLLPRVDPPQGGPAARWQRGREADQPGGPARHDAGLRRARLQGARQPRGRRGPGRSRRLLRDVVRDRPPAGRRPPPRDRRRSRSDDAAHRGRGDRAGRRHQRPAPATQPGRHVAARRAARGRRRSLPDRDDARARRAPAAARRGPDRDDAARPSSAKDPCSDRCSPARSASSGRRSPARSFPSCSTSPPTCSCGSSSRSISATRT